MKDLNQTIASRAFLATDEQVRALAILNYQSGQQVEASRGTFLKVEVASLQNALGMAPRQRQGGKPQKFATDEVMAKYNEVHKHLYSLVLEAVVTDDIKDGPKLRKAEKTRRSLERNRRSNFARSAKSTLAAFIRAGGNVAALVVPQVSKGELASQTKRLKPAVQEDRSVLADRICSRMVKQLDKIREEDHELAQQVAQRLTVQLSPVTTEKTTKSATKAADEQIPLRVGDSIFLPMPQIVSEIRPEPMQTADRKSVV